MPTLISLKLKDPAAWLKPLEASLEPAHAQHLSTAEVRGLFVCPERASLRLHLSLQAPLPSGLLPRLKESLKAGDLRQVVFYPAYAPGRITPEDFLKLHFEDLKEQLQEELDLAPEWFGLAAYRLEGDLGGGRLVLLLESAFHTSQLADRKAAAKIQDLLLQGCGMRLEVALALGDFQEALAIRQAALAEYKPPPTPAAPKPAAAKSADGKPLLQPDKVLVGRLVQAAKVRALSSIVEEEKNVACEGQVFSVEEIKLKSGRTKVKFAFCDTTDSLLGVLWLEGTAPKPKELGQGAWVRVRGYVKPDKFENEELVLEAADITLLPPRPEREDTALVKRVELHAHTKMSAADSVVDVEALVERAAAWGHPAVAITDHGVVHAFPAAAKVAKKKGIKLLLGCEAYLVENASFLAAEGPKNPPPYFHIILLCKDDEGRKNLYKLVSQSHLETFYKKPLIPKALLTSLRNGLLLGSACEQGELMQAVIQGKGEAELAEIASFYDYLEVQPLGNNSFMLKTGEAKSEEDLKSFVRRVVALGQRLGKPVVATGDVHYLNPEDELYRRILQVGNGMQDAEVQPPLYFRTTAEMLDEFAWLGAETAQQLVIDQPRKVAEACQSVAPVPQGRFFPELAGAEDTVASLAWAKARQDYGDPLPGVVKERLDRELKAILGNKFAVLYEIARKLVVESNNRGYSVGSRGSVGSSLAAYFLGITEVNPLPAHERCLGCGWCEFDPKQRLSGIDLPARACPKCGGRVKRDGHSIPFETFVGFKGDKVPDIDLNFAPEVQGFIQKYAETLFGEGRAFKAGTISTLSEKTAFGYVKKYFEAKGQPKRRVEVERIKARLEGVKRTSGQHPGGVILVRHDKEITDFTPVQYSGDSKELGGRESKDARDLVTTHFDYHAIDENLVKLDILGKDDASAFKHLQELTGVGEDEVPLDDPKAISIFSSREALGFPKLAKEEEDLYGSTGVVAIPEFGTENTRRMLELTKPKNFTELIYISGLSHGTNVWARNAEDLIKGRVATLQTVISTRDDIMNTLIAKGMDPAMAFEITEKVRKGAAAREGFTPAQEKALADAHVERWWIDSCKKIQYMFPKAHATAYCFTAVRMAWFKVHQPRAFYAAWLTLHAEGFESAVVAQGRQEVLKRVGQLRAMRMDGSGTARDEETLTSLTVALEALLRGVGFSAVDLYKSHPFRFMPEEKGSGLLPPLVSLPGLGASAAEGIERERKLAPFKSVEDLAARAGLNKTVLEKLGNTGALGVLPKTNQITLF